MAIWTVNNTRGSIARNIKTNLAQENLIFLRPVSQSTHEIKLVSYIDGTPFPDGLTQIGIRSVCAFSNPSGVLINYDAKIEFYWHEEDLETSLAISSYGVFAPQIYNANAPLAVSSYGTPLIAELMTGNINQLAINSYSEIYTIPLRRNWVRWSNIGDLDFTIGIDNVAGERPMDWSGLVYKIMKLGGKVVVYGENGVSIMTPHDINYGLTTILQTGLAGRNAIAGDDYSHFFIDRLGYLYALETDLKRIGYEEFLSKLINPVLTYNSIEYLLYICDGNLGYIYNTREKSLGEGPVNITGIGYQNGEYLIASKYPINIPNFEVWTDTIDFGTRYEKTLHAIKIGTNLTEDLWISIDVRTAKSRNFMRLPWTITNNAGIANLFCHGVEFRIGVKVNNYEYFEVDSIEIEGVIT